MLENIPDRMPEDMPDRMPVNLSIRKYIKKYHGGDHTKYNNYIIYLYLLILFKIII